MHLLCINASNVVAGTNNTRYLYKFPSSATFDKYSSIALVSCNMYFSWFNITAAYNNNKFSYTWIEGTVVQLTIPDGYYSVDTLNAYLQSEMYSRSHYLLDSTGKVIYLISIAENASLYAIQLYLSRCPTATEVGSASTSIYKNYSKPTSSTWIFPTINTARPSLTVSSTNTFRDIIGFSAKTYSSTATIDTVSFTSDYTPQVSPVSSIVMTCSLCNQPMSRPNNVLYSFGTTNVQFGYGINVAPSQLMFVPINAGNSNEFYVEFRDQDFQPMNIKDNQLVIMLAIKTKSDIMLENGIVEN